MDAIAFWSRVAQPIDGCWGWTGACYPNGYGQVWVPKRKSATTASRWAYLLTFGPIPDGHVVMHLCDNPPCCRPDHLVLGTTQANARDMAAKGRQAFQRDPSRARRGEQHGRAKLSAKQVAEIRLRLASGESGPSLAKEYGVVPQTIYWIKSGQTWGTYQEMPCRHRPGRRPYSSPTSSMG